MKQMKTNLLILAFFQCFALSCGVEPINKSRENQTIEISYHGLSSAECAFLNSQELSISAQICDATAEAEGTRCDTTGFCQGTGEKKFLDGDIVKFRLECPSVPYAQTLNIMVFYSYTGVQQYQGIGEHSCATYVSSQSSSHLKAILKGLCLAIGFDTITIEPIEKNTISLQPTKFISNFYENGSPTTNLERVCSGDLQ